MFADLHSFEMSRRLKRYEINIPIYQQLTASLSFRQGRVVFPLAPLQSIDDKSLKTGCLAYLLAVLAQEPSANHIAVTSRCISFSEE